MIHEDANMEAIKRFENYPAWIVTVSGMHSLILYGVGAWILFKTGLLLFTLYLVYVLLLEYRLIRFHCVHCYYWGRTCGFGKSRLSSWFFREGNRSEFCRRGMTWKDMIPDSLVSLIPVAAGIYLLIKHFDFIVLTGVLIIILLATFGNGFIRGSLTCKYCLQRDAGCPAAMLFDKEK